MTFQELNINRPLLNALEDLGLSEPTPIQEQSFSTIMSGKDFVGLAQTGTGKTFAYLLPLLRQLTFTKKMYPRILIVVPTRELVVQVVDQIALLTKYQNVRFCGVYGGTNINTQKIAVNQGLDVLVATPGRLVDLALTGVLRLKMIQKLVIDEVDELLNEGFRPQLANIMGLLPEKRQNIMFSATLTEEVDGIIKKYFRDPLKVEIVPQGTPLDLIKQSGYILPNINSKINILTHLLKDDTLSRTLIFVSNKKTADKLHEHLEEFFPDQMGVIHSNKSQNYRLKTLERFKNGEHRFIIATDVMARGLDVSDITHVISFDAPEEPETHIHRIGRTGRAENEGFAISIYSEAELDKLKKIENFIQQRIKILTIPEEVEISNVLTEEELPTSNQKDYLRDVKLEKNEDEKGAAFHEKKQKNKKVNLGGPGRRKPKTGKKVNRGQQKRKFKKQK